MKGVKPKKTEVRFQLRLTSGEGFYSTDPVSYLNIYFKKSKRPSSSNLDYHWHVEVWLAMFSWIFMEVV